MEGNTMKKAIFIAIAAVSMFSMRASANDAVTEASVPKQFTFAEENDDDIIVILRQEEVYVWKGNWIEPEERTIGYYLVKEDNETMNSIATKLELAEDYLMSVNKGYRGETTDNLAKYALVEIPDADWRSLSNVYCLVSEGNSLSQLAEYFYTSVDEILELNLSIEDVNMIYSSAIIQVH